MCTLLSPALGMMVNEGIHCKGINIFMCYVIKKRKVLIDVISVLIENGNSILDPFLIFSPFHYSVRSCFTVSTPFSVSLLGIS